jgi:hypothetical protein
MTEHLTHNPKIDDLSTATSPGREKLADKSNKKLKVVLQWYNGRTLVS